MRVHHEERKVATAFVIVELTLDQARLLHMQLCQINQDDEGPAVKELRLALGRATGAHQ